MPNVAGREFPYTPQGMAAADRYRQSQGMRHGGSMGFRPLGYQDGALVEPGVTPALGYTTPSLERWGAPDEELLGPMPYMKLLEPDDMEPDDMEPDDMELLLPKPPWMSHPDFKGYYDPDQLNPFFNPHEIPVADGGYVGRGMRHGGSMGFRPINPLVATGTGRRVAEETLQDPGLAGPINPLVATGMGRRAAQRSGALSGAGAGGVAEPFSYDSESRVAVIEKIMFLTKMENPLVFLEMSDEQLRATLAKVEKDALAREMQQMQQIPPPPPMLKMPPRLRPPESLLPSPQHQQQGPPPPMPSPIPPPSGLQRRIQDPSEVRSPLDTVRERHGELYFSRYGTPPGYTKWMGNKPLTPAERRILEEWTGEKILAPGQTGSEDPPSERRHGGLMSIRRR